MIKIKFHMILFVALMFICVPKLNSENNNAVINFETIMNNKEASPNKNHLQVFKDRIAGKHITVVKAFVTWCKYCKYLDPIFAKTAQQFKTVKIDNVDLNIEYIEFDAEKFPLIKEAYHVRFYPKLLYFYDGKFIGNSQRPLHEKELIQNIKDVTTRYLNRIKTQKTQSNPNNK